MNTDMESFKMNYQIFQRGVEGLKSKIEEYDTYGDRLSNCEKEIEDLKKEVAKANRPVFQGKDGVDDDTLANMFDNMKKELYLTFAKREDLENLEGRVKKLEEDYGHMDEKLEGTTTTANSNKEEIEKLKKMLEDRVDCDTFDQELANLKLAISNAGGDVSAVANNSGPSMSTKDMNKLKEVLEKFPEMQKAMDDIQKKLDQAATKKQISDLEKELDGKANRSELEKLMKDLKALQDLLNQLSRDIDYLKASGGGSQAAGGSGPNPDIIIQITNKIEKLEIKLGNLENELGGLRRSNAQTVSMPAPPPVADSTLDNAKVDSLEQRLNGLEDDFKRFNHELVKEIKNHQDQINGKADYSQLEELKDFLLGKIDDLVRGFKQFADKNDTKKALKNLEKQLKNLYDLVMTRLQGPDEDDAMFSKKPLGGFSCAS